jgi:predicted small secreted protein
MNRNTCAVVLVAMLLSGCGNFLGRTGEQMSDQPQKEKEQARAARQYDQPARTRYLPPGQ